MPCAPHPALLLCHPTLNLPLDNLSPTSTAPSIKMSHPGEAALTASAKLAKDEAPTRQLIEEFFSVQTGYELFAYFHFFSIA